MARFLALIIFKEIDNFQRNLVRVLDPDPDPLKVYVAQKKRHVLLSILVSVKPLLQAPISIPFPITKPFQRSGSNHQVSGRFFFYISKFSNFVNFEISISIIFFWGFLCIFGSHLCLSQMGCCWNTILSKHSGLIYVFSDIVNGIGYCSFC